MITECFKVFGIVLKFFDKEAGSSKLDDSRKSLVQSQVVQTSRVSMRDMTAFSHQQ
jgi:hypothetical protein